MGEETRLRGVDGPISKETVIWVEMSEPDIVGPHIEREPPEQLDKYAVDLEGGLVLTRNGEVYAQTQKGIVKIRERFGNHRVSTQINKTTRWYVVHVEVARAFIENPANLRRIRVIDGDKKNATVENLRWASFNGLGRAWFNRKGRAIENDKWRYRKLIEPPASGNPVYIMSKV